MVKSRNKQEHQQKFKLNGKFETLSQPFPREFDGIWIANTNYTDQLSNISWKQAITKIGSLNTIAVLTYHINYYIAGVLNLFGGGDLEIRDKYSFRCPGN